MAGKVGASPKVIGDSEAQIAAVRTGFDEDITEITDKYPKLIAQVEELRSNSKYSSNPDKMKELEARIQAFKNHEKAAKKFDKEAHEEGHQINTDDIAKLAGFQEEIEHIEAIFESKSSEGSKK